MTEDAAVVPAVNLSDPEFWRQSRQEVLDALARLRREDPVSRQPAPAAWAPAGHAGAPYWAVTRYDDIEAISLDTARFSTGRGVDFASDGFPLADIHTVSGFLAMDPPKHSKLRRIVSKAFTPRMVATLEPLILDEADRAISAVAARGECDFYHDLVASFPLGVVAELLGIPRGDQHLITSIDRAHHSPHPGLDTQISDMIARYRQLRAYGLELARARRENPRDDLVSALVTAEVDGAPLTDDEVGSTFVLLLTAGIHTTSSAISEGLCALTAFPDERRRWQLDYDRLAESGIEEILRWSTVLPAMRRTAVVDVDLRGQRITAGDTVVLFYLAANFDEAVFTDPYRFDVTREPNRHQAFGGGGVHFCLGNSLARAEMRIFFRELFRRLPDISVSGGVVPYGEPVARSFNAVPCEFTPVKPWR